MATQTYRGFNEAGVPGAVAGLGKGAVGTLSKPIVGVLDLANGIASAIRETSRIGEKIEKSRIRETRCCSTSGALLTAYSRSDASGQKILYQVNNFDLNEKYVALENLKSLLSRDMNRTEQTLVVISKHFYFIFFLMVIINVCILLRLLLFAEFSVESESDLC